ncbi:bifunctional phosphoglucose/phosphomannose isomerase [Candidatus Woesearchaeota archaeon CG10_big_fil_rev_8_21_14_0_10_32_9]|nr:MAG: bifunctional phosphoglucose/phosphomannose isomerase [Candidatus Woesearchaeota archaeon CG10_big_fil_rev_8_21_14_0_10_32_9]
MTEEFESEQSFPEDYYKYDTRNFKKFLDEFANDIRKGYNQSFRHQISNIKKTEGMRIIVCGMGGSGIAAMLMQTYLEDEPIDFELANSYGISGKLTSKDLVILSSYSGNTEEVISCYRQARRIGSQVIIIASGGKLEELAGMGRLPLIKLPKEYPPRAALGLMFFTLLRLLQDLAIISDKSDEVDSLTETFTGKNFNEFGVNLSEKLNGKIPIIYSSNIFYPVAYRWKTQLNENAKTLAFSNQISEMNHNELNGFENKNGIFHVVLITTDEDISRIRKRTGLVKEILQKNGVDVTELHVKGSRLNKIFTAVLAGDYTSYYLALRYGIDPYPVDTIEKFKRDLGPFI